MDCLARVPSLVIVFSVCSLLSGCMAAAHSVMAPMLDAGIRSAAEANATPESMGVSTAKYRGRDCASLKTQADLLAVEKTSPRHDPLVAKTLGWEVDAIHQVRAEQGCDKPGQARAAVESRLSAASTSALVQGTFRAKFDAVTPAFAQSLGLESPGGALVIAIEKGSTVEKAGLRPLDIITEVGGQAVQTPADLHAIVGRMRPGYKAAMRVWRQKAMREMVIEVAAPAATR